MSLAAPDLAPAPAATVSTTLVDALRGLGVTSAFGVMGGAIAPFFHAVAHSPLATYHFRHETGAAFAAIEASLATRRPVLVFLTSGPGVTNAVTGMMAARWEGAQIIFVSAATIAANRGRVATQETTAAAMGGAGLYLPGGALHQAVTIEHPAQLAPTLAQLATGLARPGGFVAHVSLPIDVQTAPAPRAAAIGDRRALRAAPDLELVRAHAARFAADAPVIWVGFGARHAAAGIRALAARLDARVMCTPRGKGIIPEDDPRFLGVTGLAGHARVDDRLAADRPRHTLVLGTRLGESSSFWSPTLAPRDGFVHVDVDPAAFGAAYPEVTTEAVLADVELYVAALLAALGPAPADEPALPVTPLHPAHPAPRRAGPVRPQVLIDAVQRTIVDGSDAWLMAESGNAFCWATHFLRFADPLRYRLSTGFGSMGHAATGVVGAALARRGKAVALVGDGAMMMQHELHSAVQYRADALWIILNDAGYLMCRQGMQVMGWAPFHCDLPRVDFVALAQAIGADGERVATEAAVGPALERALAARGPWVLDVTIDPREVPPSGRRNQSLMQQGFTASK